jgi:hypothetical protein
MITKRNILGAALRGPIGMLSAGLAQCGLRLVDGLLPA